MAKVTLSNVRKIYPRHGGGNITAIQDFNLEIADRELIVLAGPGGCGKSTILRMLAGLEDVSQGDVMIGDRRINDVPPKDRDIAMVFYGDALYPHKTAYDNLAFASKLRRYPKAEIKRRVRDAASILGIEDLLERKAGALSARQRGRVALGRAIARQPKVFLLDEALDGLDTEARAEMRAELARLHQRLQATMIYATRDQVEAMTMANRVVVMKDGAIQQAGKALDLYKQPINLFVAGFLGGQRMNFIKGSIGAAADGLLFRETNGGVIECKLPQYAGGLAKAYVGKEVVLGIRPENIELVQATQKPARCRFQAVVDFVEATGSETNVHFQTGAHTAVCRCDLQVSSEEQGHRMMFDIDPTKVHLFDAVTTLRIAEQGGGSSLC